MKVSIYGAGYVGLVSAACFAKLGHEVLCADINEERIRGLLEGDCPIYEEQLPELLQEQCLKGQLNFTSDLSVATKSADIHIIATGTPSLADDSADLSQVFAVAVKVAREIGSDSLLVIKSTVPVGTADVIREQVNEELALRDKKIRLLVASNPEFLREGCAISDFLQADRIIIGGEASALKMLLELYHPLIEQGIPLLSMSCRSAELSKYSANAMLACKISFINQISQLAEKLGADIEEVRQSLSLDHRIGPHFLQAGIGYGGSCFPKDIRALVQTAKSVAIDCNLFESIEQINQVQKNWLLTQINEHFSEQLQGLTIGIWGLAFKPGTDDLREASSLVCIKSLLEAGAKLVVFDPVAMPQVLVYMGSNNRLHYSSSATEVLDHALDALVIATEWPEFKEYDLNQLKTKLKSAPLFDGRNCFDLLKVRKAQLNYYSVGRPHVN